MPHPKKRKTKSGTRQRRSHSALEKINLAKCRKCGKLIRPHSICPACGYYGNKEMIDVLEELSDKKKKDEKEKKTKGNKTKKDKEKKEK